MSIKLSDGTVIDTTDISRLLAIVSERANGNDVAPPQPDQPASEPIKPKFEIRVEEIRSRDGVTVKVGNLPVKKKKAEHENYLESKVNGYTIRVWRYNNEEVFGCNVFKDGNIRYFEFPMCDYRDENGVFKVMEQYVRDGGMG